MTTSYSKNKFINYSGFGILRNSLLLIWNICKLHSSKYNENRNGVESGMGMGMTNSLLSSPHSQYQLCVYQSVIKINQNYNEL